MTLSEVIGLLKVNGVSQVPVVDDFKVVGILTESRLLERALSTGASSRGELRVRDIIESNYCTVDEATEITVLTEPHSGPPAAGATSVSPDGSRQVSQIPW